MLMLVSLIIGAYIGHLLAQHDRRVEARRRQQASVRPAPPQNHAEAYRSVYPHAAYPLHQTTTRESQE